ncbi:hypothetical protein AYL99_02229 [Fonsecaea erecta]|uniref:Uncharacterized protein n=1 Tax=Fonsecaea erecta TaxID=1367422 RepID=A0A178ZTA3_9EURO|nr:hypothetical protein AYL99_02229 [Fonsecaea erecta]OAP63002.1 hypothetical protein AYL99_02229 [Fonsecaea erecta]
MDQQNTPPAADRQSTSVIPRMDSEQHQHQHQHQHQRLPNPDEAGEKVRIWNGLTWQWKVLRASIDDSLPWPRIDLEALRRVYGPEMMVPEGAHCHPGDRVNGRTCIGTVELRCMSHVCPETFRGIFCVVQGEEGRVVLTRSLLPDPDLIGIFTIGCGGNKEQNRLKKESKEKVKPREKKKSAQKDRDRSKRDDDIRGEPSTQQQQQQGQQSTS